MINIVISLSLLKKILDPFASLDDFVFCPHNFLYVFLQFPLNFYLKPVCLNMFACLFNQFIDCLPYLEIMSQRSS